MRIRLKDFKQHEELDLELPDQGLVLFKGVSGSGKTSAIDGVHDANWGSLAATKPWGGGKTSEDVEYTIPEPIRIIRTKTPDTLTVTTGRGTFRDDEAQKEITRVFGMNEQEALAASYTRQRMEGSLLRLGPADQLRFIQRLAFRERNPEIQRKRLAKILDQYDRTANAEDIKLAQLKDSVAERERSLNEARSKVIDPALKYTEDFTDKLREYRDKCVLVETLSRRHGDLAKEGSNAWYGVLASWDGQREQLVAQLAKASEDVAEAHKYFTEATRPYATMSLGDYNARMAILEKKRKFLKDRQKVSELVAQIRAEWPGSEGKPVGAALQELQVSISGQYQAAVTEASEARARVTTLEESLKAKPCPACKTMLMVKDGSLHVHGQPGSTDGIQDQIAGAKSAAKAADHKIAVARANTTTVGNLLAKVNALKAELIADPDPAIPDEVALQVESDRLKVYDDEQMAHQQVLTQRKANVDSLSRNHAFLAMDLKKREEAIANAPALRPQADVEVERLSCNADLQATKQSTYALESYVEKQRERERDEAAYKASSGMISKMESELAGFVTKVTEQEGKLKLAQDKLGARKRLQELSDFAAVEAVEGYLAEINGVAEEFIGRLFPDTGTTIRIMNTSKTAKDEERAKFSLEIFHKGHYAGKKLDVLSGGEQDRAVLAYQLSLSELYETPFLFIDEGFAGADVEKTMLIGLEVLKEVSQKKLVIVVQHGAPEHFFDQIVDF